MKDEEPIGFVTDEESPEIAEIGKAINEADQWILWDNEQIDYLKSDLELTKSMIDYAAENDLKAPDVSIADLENKIKKAEEQLQKDRGLKEQMIELQGQFSELDWRRNLQEIKIKHLLEKNNFSKTVD